VNHVTLTPQPTRIKIAPAQKKVPRRKLWVVRGNIEDVAAAVGSNDIAGLGWWSLTGRQNQFCLGHGDRRQALRLRRTASRLRGLTATRMAASSALVPSMTRSVRRRGGAASVLAAADVGGCQEAKELAAGCVEGTLLGFGLAMGEQRAAVVADEVADDLLDRLPAKAAVHLQSADDFTAKHPDVVAVGSVRDRASLEPLVG
jgi:hypothetical protein